MTFIWSIECIEGDRPAKLDWRTSAVGAKKPTSMYAEDLVIDDNAQRQEVEHVGEVVPDIRIAVFPRAFRIKPI